MRFQKGCIGWNKGRTGVYSEETIRKISESHKGMHHTEESKKKMSETRKGLMAGEKHPMFGKHHSAETLKKISGENHHNFGKHANEESRRKNSEGHKNPSKETRDKISAALRLRVRKKETGIKISATKMGIPIEKWNGYARPQPYCEKFNGPFRERVRAFFGNCCVECGTPNSKRKLSVHHVNFRKDACCSDAPRYFILLCGSCHSKTNYNREFWKNHFTEIIDQYYEGKSYFTKEEFALLRGKNL